MLKDADAIKRLSKSHCKFSRRPTWDSHHIKVCRDLVKYLRKQVFYLELEFACWLIQAQWTFIFFMFDFSVCETLQSSWITFHIVWQVTSLGWFKSCQVQIRADPIFTVTFSNPHITLQASVCMKL